MPDLSNRQLVIIWQRFGPYHLVRIDAAKVALADLGFSVTGLQLAAQDHYQWETLESECQTVFRDRPYEQLKCAEIRDRLDQTLTQLQPAVVAINGWAVTEALAAMRWCQRNKKPAVLMSESFLPSDKWWKEWLKRRRVQRFASAVVGGRLHLEYLAKLGIPRDQIFVGYDAIDNSHFSQLPKAAAPPRPYFLAVTRFIPRKNVDRLLRAYRVYLDQTSKTESTWDLVISGSGEEEGNWKALARELSLEEFVRWPGFVQYHELPDLYRNASAFVHVATREPWGLVLNEAAAAGLPIIASSQVGASSELVKHEQNGLLVDAHATDQITNALRRVASLPTEQLAAWGKCSAEIVAEFGPARFGQAMRAAVEFALRSACFPKSCV